jgi:hypothetical protein
VMPPADPTAPATTPAANSSASWAGEVTVPIPLRFWRRWRSRLESWERNLG